jgi:hypothetical protein
VVGGRGCGTCPMVSIPSGMGACARDGWFICDCRTRGVACSGVFQNVAADVTEAVVKWSVSVWIYALRPQRAGLLLNMRRREDWSDTVAGLRSI